jgi:hypothetical protein
MTTEFIADRVWPAITEAARNTKSPAYVAVAYFGGGASKLLPLNKGSRLVVDASEHAVKSGQTSPAELLKLVRKGVKVYSIENLHAKVFVFGRTSFVGSANVSKNSENTLFEAVVRTTDNAVVSQVRHVVKALCLQQYTPKILSKLKELYRPPRVPGGKRVEARVPSNLRLPKTYLAQLVRDDLLDEEEKMHDRGWIVAERMLKRKVTKQVDSFIWHFSHAFDLGDIVVKVTQEDDGRVFVSPPGNVIHIEQGRFGRGGASCVFLEIPAGKRRRLFDQLARKIGNGAAYKLGRDGRVRDRALVMTLLKAWQD